MFKLYEKYEVNGNILKCDYNKYSPSEFSTMDTNSQIYINVPREDSVCFFVKSYLDLIFDVLHAASNDRYTDNKNIRIVNLSPFAKQYHTKIIKL